MKRLAWFVALSTWTFIACGGGPPKQAAPPQSNVDDDPTSSGAGSADLEAAQAALKTNDCATARGKAQAVLDKSPTSAEALFVLGICDDADKQPESAIRHYKAALAADPKLTGAAVDLSADLIDAKLYDDAITVVEAIFKAAGDQAKATAELHVNLAYAYKGKGDHETAARSFANAVKLQDTVALHLEFADELLAAQHLEAAQKEFKSVIAKATDVDTMAEAAAGLGASGDAPGCVAAYDKVVAQKSTPEFLTERAICKHKAKDLAGARKDAEAALVVDAGYWKALAAAAKYAEEAKDKKACKQHYEALAAAVKGKDGFGSLQSEAEQGAARCK